MFIVAVEFVVKETNVGEFREAMQLQASNSLALESGCHQFDVCYDINDAKRCFLYEKYDDRTAFDEHLQSEHFRQFDALVGPWLDDKRVQTWELQT